MIYALFTVQQPPARPEQATILLDIFKYVRNRPFVPYPIAKRLNNNSHG